MSANDEAGSSDPPRTTHEPRLDSTTEYCARWLATISAAQPDEPSLFVQGHSSSEVRPQDSVSDNPGSSSSTARVSSPRATRHLIEARDLPPATTSSTPSHVDATPEPEHESEIPVRAACYKSPCARPREVSRYEKQPRRKTRPDCYDTSRQHRDGAGISRRGRRERKREKLRSRREIMANFYSAATENRQVLMKPALATGAFVNGRGSVSTPLADLTFNELTFPIARKVIPRATSPQPPNGARKRAIVQVEASPDWSERQKKRPLVTAQVSPGTPAPGPRQDGATQPKQSQLLNENDPKTSPRKRPRPVSTTRCRARKYVDIGVDTMRHAAGFAPAPADLGQAQLPPAEHQSSQHVNPYALYYTPLPMYMPQYYAPLYPANGMYSQAGLQPNPPWAERVPPQYASQHMDGIPMQQDHPLYTSQYMGSVPTQQEHPFYRNQCMDSIPMQQEYPLHTSQCMDSMPMQQEWPGSGHQNGEYDLTDYTVPPADVYPSLAAELDDFTVDSLVHDAEPQNKPDEETKAFWRPNFLR